MLWFLNSKVGGSDDSSPARPSFDATLNGVYFFEKSRACRALRRVVISKVVVCGMASDGADWQNCRGGAHGEHLVEGGQLRVRNLDMSARDVETKTGWVVSHPSA